MAKNRKKRKTNSERGVCNDNCETSKSLLAETDRQRAKATDPCMSEDSKKNELNKSMTPSSTKKTSTKKRKHPSLSSESTSQKPTRAIFNGLILAISTLESKTPTTDNKTKEANDPYLNFKTLSTLLKDNGATISPQVHKRVHYLISTQQAIDNLTQRVRQALKRNVDIVDVDWVKRCVEEGVRVEAQGYLLNDLVKELMDAKKVEAAQNNLGDGNERDGNESDIPDENAAGWSSPIQLDCCCVCHENGDVNCPWCTECNINLAKKN